MIAVASIKRCKLRRRFRIHQPRGNGFSLLEALIALMIGSLALLLIGGAGYSLQLISGDRSGQLSGSAERILARRIIHAWLADKRVPGSIRGDQSHLHLQITHGGVAANAELVVRSVPGGSTLEARILDAHAHPVPSILLRHEKLLRFRYLVGQPEGNLLWQDLVETRDPVDLQAVMLLAGDDNLVLTSVSPTLSASCLVRAALEINRCRRG